MPSAMSYSSQSAGIVVNGFVQRPFQPTTTPIAAYPRAVDYGIVAFAASTEHRRKRSATASSAFAAAFHVTYARSPRSRPPPSSRRYQSARHQFQMSHRAAHALPPVSSKKASFNGRSRSRSAPDRGSRSLHDSYSDDYDDITSEEEQDEELARGQWRGAPGTMLLDRYEYLYDLGKGTFGKVLACYDHNRRMTCAVKVVRAVPRYLQSAKIEADILFRVNHDEERVRREPRNVKLLKTFAYQGHECLVFEQLGPSLLDEQKRIKYQPFDMRIIRHVSRQVLEALEFLHDHVQLVHTDVKMENVLFVASHVDDCSRAPPLGSFAMVRYDVKLIDFGGATYRSSKNDGTINTRQYRAPEVILNLGWDFPSDVWGVGALMMELFLGDLLFQSNQISEHLALMERVRGHRFPEGMRRDSDYFDRHGRVKWPQNSEAQSHIRKMRSLSDQVYSTSKSADVERCILDDFYEVVHGMLNLDPKRRLTARDVLRSRYFRYS